MKSLSTLEIKREQWRLAAIRWRQKHPGYYSIKNAPNPDAIRIKRKAWNDKNIEKRRASNATYRKKNKEREAARRAAWREANPGYSATWNAEHGDWKRAHSAKWAKDNPEKRHNARVKRRTAKKENGGNISVGLIETMMTGQGGMCVFCKGDLKTLGYHVDHIDPIARGGSNTDDNVQLLCPPCNLAKGAKNPIDYLLERGILDDILPPI
jgi:5-methylcytosine-specific restriction endonuclease McrA